jgi:hypothetical protein
MPTEIKDKPIKIVCKDAPFICHGKYDCPNCSIFKKTDIQNHKGQWCKYAFVFCQESYCSNCMVFKRTESFNKN